MVVSWTAKLRIISETTKRKRKKCANVQIAFIIFRVKGVRWFTNLDHNKRHEELDLVCRYSPEEYPHYDNYNAIDISKTAHIPYNYDGAMGVPITFLDKYNPEQFEIIKFRKGDDEKDLRVNGKCPYFRIIIRNKHPQKI